MRSTVERPAISMGPALMIPAGYPRDLPSALLRAARDYSAAGVIEVGPDGRATRLDFPILLELAARILAGLRANGVRPGDPAIVHCTEPVAFLASFWACTLGGIRPLLMAPAAEGDTTEEGRERLRRVTEMLGWTVLIGRPSDLPSDLGLPVLDPDALAGHEPASDFHRPAADDVAVVMMSSGSTGTPKLIQLTHRGLVEFAAGTPAMLPIRPGQTTLNWLPLDHSGAFLLYHLLPVFTGCTNIHVATDWVLTDPLRWLDLMDQHRVNHSWSPNFGYRLVTKAIADVPDRHWDLSALRSLVSGGEQITVPVMSEFLRVTNRFGIVPETFVAAWGMTETVTGITFARPGLTPNVHRVRIAPTGTVEWVDQRSTGKVVVARPGRSRADAPDVLSLVSVGAPAPGATVRIVGPDGAVLPEGRVGQLQVASARVTPGYLGNPEADRAAFPAGNWPARKWLATGDQAFITGGQVVITGRNSDRIILNGHNYYAHDLEAVGAAAEGAQPGLIAACGVADPAAGTDRLVIFYAVATDPVEGVAEAIRTAVHDRLGLDAQVVGVPREHFPTTPGGKILRPLLKQRWLDGTLVGAEPAAGRRHPGSSPAGGAASGASSYGDPAATSDLLYGAMAGEGTAGDDPGEETTELPVIRLASRKRSKTPIPVPPERPKLGAGRLQGPVRLEPEVEAPADPGPRSSAAVEGSDAAAEDGSAAADNPAASSEVVDESTETAADELGVPQVAEPGSAVGTHGEPAEAEIDQLESDPAEAAPLDAVASVPGRADAVRAETEAVEDETAPAEQAGPQPDAPQVGATQADAVQIDASQADAGQVDAPQVDVPRVDGHEAAAATRSTGVADAVDSRPERDSVDESLPTPDADAEGAPATSEQAGPNVVAAAPGESAVPAESDTDEAEESAETQAPAKAGEAAGIEGSAGAEGRVKAGEFAELDGSAETEEPVEADESTTRSESAAYAVTEAGVDITALAADVPAGLHDESNGEGAHSADAVEGGVADHLANGVAANGLPKVPATEPVAAAGVTADAVVRAFRAVLGPEVDERTPLYELGVDSVSLVRLHTRLQEELGVEFPRAAMFERGTILALSNYLAARAAGGQVDVAAPVAVEPIAIIGMAVRFPGANTLDQFWDNLVAGVESIRPFSPEELAEAGPEVLGDDDLVAVGGALDDVEAFDAAYFGISAREAELTDPAQRIFLEVCQHALEHGGYAGVGGGRIGVFAGSGLSLHTHHLTDGVQDEDSDTPMPSTQPDFLATRAAYRLGLTGPAIGVQTAGSSSLVAVHLACQALRSGDAELALAGAAAVHTPQATGYRPRRGSILSPTGKIRAFDADADGTVGGNGVAAVLLKRLDRAVADGDTIHAVIRGSAVNNDGTGKDDDITPGGPVELIERALEQAGAAAESLSYIEANATGTAPGDPAEFRALSTALRRHTGKVGFCTIGSVKPNVGHLDSASGMAGLVKAVLMLRHRTLVPTINYTRPNPELELDGSPFVIGTEVREWESATPLRAGVSALGAGGTNAHVILEEAPRQVRRADDGPVVLPLSAPDPEALADLAGLLRTELEHGTGHRLIDLAGTAALGRSARRHRIAVTGTSEAELAHALADAQPVEVPRGGPGPLGFAFTGQGAARHGMAAGLAARFPGFRSVIEECDTVYAAEFGGSLLELLLTPAGTEGVWPTETAQPALFAFELALARLWQSFGVEPALVVGHSVGEYAALCVAGALSLADGVRLTAQRGLLMQRGTAPGAMVAVRADADRVRELVQTPGVEIAAGNGPQSFVLTGAEVVVGQLAEQLDRLEVTWQRLDVDRAFHSSLVEPILADFAEAVRKVTLKPLRTPMVSSWSGELLETGTVLDGEYLVGQLRQPVLFGDAVEALTAAGCRRFLELGPDAVLSPAGRRIAPSSAWIPAQRLGQDPVLATMNGLAELYRQGTEITWSRVYPDAGRVPLPPYPFRRVRHLVDVSVRSAGRVEPQVVDEPPMARAASGGKKIVLDPSPVTATVTADDDDAADEASPFAIPIPREELMPAGFAWSAELSDGAGATAGGVGSVEPEPLDPTLVAQRYQQSLEVVLDLTGEQLGLDPYDVTVDHTFLELGADSLSMLRVVEEVRQRFDVALAVSELFAQLDTPHKLATAVASRNKLTAASGAVAPDDDTTGEATRPIADAAREAAEGDPRVALAVLGSGLAELVAKVDAAAAETRAGELPGTGMAKLMSEQLRVAGQLVEQVTQLMRDQLAVLTEISATRHQNTPQASAPADKPTEVQANEPPEVPADGIDAPSGQGSDVPELAFWRATLDGAQPLELPIDHPRPADASAGRAETVHELGAELGDAVFAFSRDQRVSPLMTLIAAVATVLGRFAAQDDLVIGTAALRRPIGVDPATDDQVAGRSFRPIPLRLDLSGEPDLGELAQRVRETTTAAFDHAGADLSGLGPEPLFRVLVEFDTDPAEDSGAAATDLRLRLDQHPGGVRCTADYDAGLYERSTVQRILQYVEAVLRRATTTPGSSLPELMALTETDRQTLAELEGSAVEPTGEAGALHRLFEEQAARTPDAVALIQGDREVSYAELDRRSNAVAWQLVDLGVRPGQLVAVRVARGAELVVAVLAVLKSGAAYLPLDPAVGESRWFFMTSDAGAVALVGDDAALADRLGLRLVPVAAVDGDARARQAPPTRPSADDVAYCIYTSGSDGTPKRVVVPHRGPVSLVREYLRTRRPLRTLQWTSFGLDVHMQEVFTTLAAGATLVLVGENDRHDLAAVAAVLRHHEVERLFMTYTSLSALLTARPELPALREIVVAGEAMVLTHTVRDFLAAHPGCELYYEYGPTEASVITTVHRVDPAEDRPSVGRPIQGVVVRLLDPALRPVPVGAIGEIHLGGAVVAKGYLGRPDETEAAFVPDPVQAGGRLYRSRDLGRWRPDGTLEHLGRVDDQVKVRGHRVEPGEAEHVLADLPGVSDAVVVAGTDPYGEKCLIGYVVLADGEPTILAELMQGLAEVLPSHLVPAVLVPVDELPLNAGGKLDRAGLPAPDWGAAEAVMGQVVDAVPLTSIERRCLQLDRTSSAACNLAQRVLVTGDVDPAALGRALQALASRHPALRSRIVDQADGGVLQVLDRVKVRFRVQDLADGHESWAVDLASEAFRLDQAPLWRAGLGRLDDDRWVVVLALHHLVCDDRSLALIWSD
ncbi:MAG TPA: amino acid adenylation domain-containing protein, partial [Kribbella sp.]|nr:amino acid adenylation domain-containing protein [Kribbella sp.]